MISQFREQHLLTSPFTGKSIVFLGHTNTLLTPANSRVSSYSLDSNHSCTLPFQSHYDLRFIVASPDGSTLTAIDTQNNIIVAELAGNTIVMQVKSKLRISCVSYSPDGKMLAMTRGNQLVIYKAPTLQKQLSKLESIKKLQNKHSSDIKSMKWSPDSRFVITWGKDNSVILNSVFRLRLYNDIIIQAHKIEVISAFFIGTSMRVMVTLDQLGKMCIWRWVNDFVSEGYKEHQQLSKQKKLRHAHTNNEVTDQAPYTDHELTHMSAFERGAHQGRFVLSFKRQLKLTIGKNFGRIKSAEYHEGQRLLIVGQRNGILSLLRFEEEQSLASDSNEGNDVLGLLQSFSATEGAVSALSFNHTAEWIALGIRSLGQLILWEWRSQTQVLSQQQLSYETTAAASSSSLIATGSVSGAVRLWDTSSYMCIARFDATKESVESQSHTSKVTALLFVPGKEGVLVTSSLDGTVRAFDTTRLKCFKVLRPENANQLTCLAADPSGEIVCAGGFDPYEIYCWQLQTGQLLEVVAGHKGPISCLHFSQSDEAVLLISASWDKTVRMHDLYSRASRQGAGGDTLEHNSEITALAIRNDGRQLVTATMKGEVLLWDTRDANIVGTIDVDRDIQGGRATDEMLSAQKNQNKRHFTSLTYSQDGNYVLGGGNSKFVCMYDTRFRVLLKKFTISQNLSLEGMKLKIDYNKVQLEQYSDEEEQKESNLPGAKSLDVTKRSAQRVHVHVHSVEFSASNKSFIVAHSEGVSIFGPQLYDRRAQLFDPLLVDEETTISAIRRDAKDGNFLESLTKSLKLNVIEVSLQVYNIIPMENVSRIVSGIPEKFIPRLINTISQASKLEKKIERDLIWAKEILIRFGQRGNTEINVLSYLIKNVQIINSLVELQIVFKTQFMKIDMAASSCINRLEFFQLQKQLQGIQTE